MTSSSRSRRIFERALGWTALRVFRCRPLARALFGIELRDLGPDDYYFDLSTIVAVRRAATLLPRGARLLDLGTGAHAVIGLSLWKRLGAQVTCADVNPTLVALARESVSQNRAPVRVVQSRFFANLADAPFDTVLVNPPYVPEAAARALALPEARRSQWDGGRDGFAVIDGLLDALDSLERPVRVLITVNRAWVPAERLRAAVGARAALRYERVWRSLWLPIDVHDLRRNGP